MLHQIIGRVEEKAILQNLLEEDEPHLLAVYGRRRIGKTFLIKTFFSEHMIFDCSGELDGTMETQLTNFKVRIDQCFGLKNTVTPITWQAAFQMLENCLGKSKRKNKKVLFFDELPWLDTRRSGFLSAFSYWWNMYASRDSNRLVIICGSAASWMIKHIVNNKGGLHNRITQRLRLIPFTLKETENYLLYRNVRLPHIQVLQIYMVMGGIPHYLNTFSAGKSISQTIQKTCFTKDGLLANEFQNLYHALFAYADKHLLVVKLLASKLQGLTRSEIVDGIKIINSGGAITQVLEELCESGFVDKIEPFNKIVKGTVFRLTDEFTAFYLRFIEKQTATGSWVQIQNSPTFLSWCGYAYENICFRHIQQIKAALGIAAVYSLQSSWRLHGNKTRTGTQIDLMIDRADGCINLCEIKFVNKEFVITKKYAQELQNKRMVFLSENEVRKTVFVTMITTYGVANNEYKVQQIENTVNMEQLFE